MVHILRNSNAEAFLYIINIIPKGIAKWLVLKFISDLHFKWSVRQFSKAVASLLKEQSYVHAVNAFMHCLVLAQSN